MIFGNITCHQKKNNTHSSERTSCFVSLAVCTVPLQTIFLQPALSRFALFNLSFISQAEIRSLGLENFSSTVSSALTSVKIRNILSACLIRSAVSRDQEYQMVSKYGLTPDIYVPIATEKKNKPRRIDVNGEIFIFVTDPEEIASVSDDIFRLSLVSLTTKRIW